MMKPWGFAAAAYLALSGACLADSLDAQPSFSRATIGFVAAKAYGGGTLTVVGPNGFAASVTNKAGLPILNLAQFGAVPDGQYTYQLSAATAELDTSATTQNNGRANSSIKPRKGVALSGVFVVRGGSIVIPLATAALRAGGAQDQD